MEFENLRFDQTKLLKMWEQSRREVEEITDYDDKDTRADNQQRHGSKTFDEKDLIIDDMRDELSYLRRKLKESKYREEDLEDEVGDVTYTKEKLEAEIDKVVQELTAVKNLLKEKQSIEEETIKAKEISDNCIGRLERQNENLEARIFEVEKLSKEQESEIVNLKKDRSENEVNEEISSRKEVENLEKEIHYLRAINSEKKDLLKKVSEANESVKEQLKQIEMENEKLKMSQEGDITCSVSLYEELEMCMMNSNDCKCEFCNKTFKNEKKLEEHEKFSHKRNLLEKQLNEFEKRVLKQRNSLIQTISKIKEEEIKEAPSCKTCKVNCKIWHTKHNWNKSKADYFLMQVAEIRTTSPDEFNTTSFICDNCEDVFERYCDLADHAKEIHNPKKASVSEIEDSTVDSETQLEGDNYVLHQEVGKEPKVLCNICMLSFKRKDDLEEHKSNHTDQVLLPSILKRK